MKKLLLLFCIIGATTSFAQLSSYKKQPTLTVNVLWDDFKSARLINEQSLSSVLRDKTFSSLGKMNKGLSVGYLNGITEHIDFRGNLGATIIKYPFKNRPTSNFEDFLFEASANINVKLLTDRYAVNPYLTAGVAASKFDVYFGALIPVGAGFQFNLGKDQFLFTQALYKIGITELASNHFNFSLGFGVGLKNKKAEPMLPPPPPPAPSDRDGDGVIDANDKCPDVKGIEKYDGCPIPDTDNDGINDEDDACPTVAGTAKYKGCPVPDTDKDGVNDDNDACPTVAGFARYKGCPIPDTDKDGVNDEEDECINRPGPVSNKGCPLPPKPEAIEAVNMAATRIFFQTGSAKLLPKSYTALKQVVDIMQKEETLGLDIEGHTDNTGSDELNQKLSEDRAASVYNYLKDNGVSEIRLSSKGYGESQPKADNKTAAGRAQNRRVVMTLKIL